MSVVVMKFGGTSVANAERIESVAKIVKRAHDAEPDGLVVVVVSALAGVTTALIELAQSAARGGAFETEIEAITQRHEAVVHDLDLENDALCGEMEQELARLVQGAGLLGEASSRTTASINAIGELWSAKIMRDALRASGVAGAEFEDARDFIVTNDGPDRAVVQESATEAAVRKILGGRTGVIVVPGFIARSASGHPTTLGRGGSDYTAALVGAALESTCVEIWTDVPGVMTCDPKYVPSATTIDQMSFDELIELSFFGAKVVYAPTVHPVRKKSIPLTIRSSMAPELPGTVVQSTGAPTDPCHAVRGIASTGEAALIRLEGDGLSGRARTAERLFRVLADRDVRLLMVSQGASGHSVSFAIELRQLPVALEAIQNAFELEIQAGWLCPPIVQDDACCIAVVGEGMQKRVGVAGRLFNSLAEEGVSVRAIAQGSSELNISFVVSRADERAAVRAVHRAFFERAQPQADIYLAGIGNVGREVLKQIGEVNESGDPAELSIQGIANSRGAILGGDVPADANGALDRAMTAASEPSERVIEKALEDGPRRRIFVDCSSDPALAARHPELLRSGAIVVTANKHGVAAPPDEWRALSTEASRSGRFYHETTVGAGLPVLSTIEGLIGSGDRVTAIRGTLSGTLSFVLNSVGNGFPFSEAVAEAKARGMTERDPLQDLSGTDVVRKAVILARAAGFHSDPSAVAAAGLLDGLDGGEIATEHTLDQFDDYFAELGREARAAAQRLVFLAEIGPEELRVGLKKTAASDPLAQGSAGDNVIEITTLRYQAPIVLTGPGAGPEVTAGGVVADVLRSIGARPRST